MKLHGMAFETETEPKRKTLDQEGQGKSYVLHL